MGDVVQRLRDGVDAGAVDLADIMDAADEIARLRLTAAEREAVEGAIIHMETRGVWAWPATLRGLLQRLEVTCPVPEPMPKEKRA